MFSSLGAYDPSVVRRIEYGERGPYHRSAVKKIDYAMVDVGSKAGKISEYERKLGYVREC